MYATAWLSENSPVRGYTLVPRYTWLSGLLLL
jgi:hypothetical protein